MKQYLLKVWMTAALSLLVVGGVWGQESYTPGYPNVSDITHESAKLNVSASVGGMIQLRPRPVYAPSHYTLFIVLDANEDKPTIEEVISWSFDGNGELISEGRYGEIGLSASNTKFSIEAYNLSSETSYVAYFVTTEDFETSVIGATEPTAVPFTTTAAPTPLTADLSPADDAPNVPVSTSTFEITFSENVELAGGTVLVELYQSGTVVGSTGLYSTNISNNVVSLSFNHTLEYEKEYEIVFPANAIKSVATGALFPGLSAGEWSFTTEVEPDPLLMNTSSLFPANSSDEVPRAPTLEVSFNQAITWGPSGVLTIHRYDNDATVATISPGETGATISQDKLSIIFSSDRLEYGTKYYVIIDEGFVKALNTSAVFPGLTDKTVWTFTTETAPPFWKEGYPFIGQQDANKLNLNVLADQTGTVYAVITSNPVAPSAEQIALGKNAVGESALVSVNGSVESISDPTVLTVDFGTSVPLGTFYFLHTVLKNDDDKYSDVESIAVDRIVPKINEDETYPEDGYSNMGVSEDIVIVFSEHVFGADGLELTSSNFALTHLVEGTSTSVHVDFSVSSTSERTTVTLNPVEDLAPITDYTITIQSVYDASGNASGVLTWSFQTDGEFTWTGEGDDNDWTNSANWDGGTYVSGKSVVISGTASSFPIVKEGDTVSVHNLTIEPKAVLTQTGGTINVSGEFHLLSSAERNASYLPQGGVLNVEGAEVDKVFVHQVIPVPNDAWIFLMGAPTLSADALNSGSGFQMRWYDNTTDTWNNNNLNKMIPGVGYSVYSNNDLVFRGEINRMDVSTSLTRTDGKGFGWNVLGNPFPASMSWDLIVNDSENVGVLNKIENSYWVWNPRNAIYDAFNGEAGVGVGLDGTIPSNHGFLVKVKINEASADLMLKSNSLVPNSLSYLKSASKAPEHFKLKAGNVDFEDKLAVAFIDEATVGVDKFDTEKRFGSGKNPFEIFTLAGSSRLTINSLPYAEEQMVALGYSASKTGSYSIAMDEFVAEGISVELIDHDNGVITNLSAEDAYTFNVGSKGVNTTRFTLKLIGPLTTKIDDSSSSLDSFSLLVEDQIVWLSAGRSLSGTTYRVYDVSGRLVVDGKLSDGSLHNLGSFNPGVYLVTINGEEMHHVQKIVVY